MNTEVLPQMNVFMYTVSFHLQVTASLKFYLFKIGAKLDILLLRVSWRLLPAKVWLPKPV
jgi:hypothetical protein